MNATAEKQWLGHPRGLATLFSTEMWERFSYYGMRALLILYMTTPAANGGLGFSTAKSGPIYGFYTFGVYFLSLPGGWIADKFLGLYRSVLIGGIIIALGHFSMAFHGVGMFYVGLVLIVIGTGMLKPNVSSLVGTLYDQKDGRRDAGFSLFYMGINIGAFASPLICGYLGERVDWHWGFAAAGIGMTIGLIQYVMGRRYIIGPDAPKTEAAVARQEHRDAPQEPFTPIEWRRIQVIGILFLFSIVFWMSFEQAGSSLNLFAQRYTDRHIFGWEMPASILQSVQPIFVIILSPIFAWIWLRLNRANREPSSPAKFSLGLVIVGLGMLVLVPASSIAQSKGIHVSVWWLIATYFLHTVAELCLSPVGLSVVTKLAPPRIGGQMMGVWFGSIAFGNLAAGFAAGLFDRLPLPKLFGAVGLMAIAAGIILVLMMRPIKTLMGGVR